MNDINNPTNPLRLLCFQFAFGETHVEDLLPKGLVKYGLNKLRWVLTDSGICHYYLPEMPIADYIMMAACLDGNISDGNTLSTTVFYRVLAARNILKLLCRAYNSNVNVKNYYDLPIRAAFEVIRNDHLLEFPDANILLKAFSLSSADTLKIVTGKLLACIDPIVDLSDNKSCIAQKLIAGTNNEQRILSAYELYHLLFPVFFSLQLPSDYSAEVLNKKYHTTKFRDANDEAFTNAVHSWKERSSAQ